MPFNKTPKNQSELQIIKYIRNSLINDAFSLFSFRRKLFKGWMLI